MKPGFSLENEDFKVKLVLNFKIGDKLFDSLYNSIFRDGPLSVKHYTISFIYFVLL